MNFDDTEVYQIEARLEVMTDIEDESVENGDESFDTPDLEEFLHENQTAEEL